MPHHSNPSLTQEELHQLLDYDPETGLFRWKIDKGSAKAGQIAGCVLGDRQTYTRIKIRVKHKLYTVPCLIWLYMYGRFPTRAIYHVSGDTSDNRLSNLREGPHKQDLTQESLQETLDYDPETGIFRWKIKTCAKVQVGKVAGSHSACGYLKISIQGKLHLAHRLAWLYMYGRWPIRHIDHINGVRADNRIANLREATPAENAQNKRKSARNTTGYLGVSKCSRTKKYAATIYINRKCTYLGIFPTPEEAHQAYLSAKAKLHTFQPTPRS